MILTAQMAYACELVASGVSAKRAARRAGVSLETLSLPQSVDYIEALYETARKSISIDRERLIQWHYRRATYDPNEFASVAVGACRYCHTPDHSYAWRKSEYLEALAKALSEDKPEPVYSGEYDARRAPNPDCPECDGRGIPALVLKDTQELSPDAKAAYEGAEQTPSGSIKVKMADKTKAMENLQRLLGYDKPLPERTGDNALEKLDNLEDKSVTEIMRLFDPYLSKAVKT